MTDGNRSIKCVVWDLDDTLWRGVLLEDPAVQLRPEAVETIHTLDARGILHSIASRGDPDAALLRLKTLALDEYFLHPQIGWGAKATAIETIARALNIGVDACAFVDDDPFEREAVRFAHPEILCLDAAGVASFPRLPALSPAVVTDEAAMRRVLYRRDLQRRTEEEAFADRQADFLATLDLVLTIRPADERDLDRSEELTHRTHQLNSTGIAYSRDDLSVLCRSGRHRVLVASLRDRFGPYGQIGLILLETDPDAWTVKLLLTSCRVASRGIGTALLSYLAAAARRERVRLLAEFVPRERNRIMYVTLRLAGLQERERRGDVILLEHPLSQFVPLPDYMQIEHSAAFTS
jgi:FkbH-like protein